MTGVSTDVAFFYFVNLKRDGDAFSGPFRLWNNSGAIDNLSVRIQVFETEDSLGFELFMGPGLKVWPNDRMVQEELEVLADQGDPLSNLAMVVLYYLEKILESTSGQLLDSDLCGEASGDFTLDLRSALALKSLFTKTELN